MSDNQVPVPARLLALRINRILARRRLWLRKTPKNDIRALQHFGDYFVFDVRRNRIAKRHVDIEDYGRRIGALRPHECLERAPSPALNPNIADGSAADDTAVIRPTAVARLISQ